MADDVNASNGQYIYVPNGTGSAWKKMATYTVTITEASEYILWGRAIAPSVDDDSFFIQIDEEEENLWDIKRGSDWQWDKVSHRGGDDPVTFTLSAGTHTIKVKVREDGTKIDKLLLTNDISFVPSGTGEVSASNP